MSSHTMISGLISVMVVAVVELTFHPIAILAATAALMSCAAAAYHDLGGTFQGPKMA